LAERSAVAVPGVDFGQAEFAPGERTAVTLLFSQPVNLRRLRVQAGAFA
jgi:hypothetical protein